MLGFDKVINTNDSILGSSGWSCSLIETYKAIFTKCPFNRVTIQLQLVFIRNICKIQSLVTACIIILDYSYDDEASWQ